MYEIKKVKVVKFAVIFMFLNIAIWLLALLVWLLALLFSFASVGSTSASNDFFSQVFGGVGGGFLLFWLIGLVFVLVSSFIGGLLIGAVYNFISTKFNLGLRLDIVQIVEKEKISQDKGRKT